MADAPSWHTSTLSQAFVLALAFYMAFILILTVGVIWFKLPLEVAEKVVPWGTALWGSVTSAYLAARKVNGEVKTNGEVPAKP